MDLDYCGVYPNILHLLSLGLVPDYKAQNSRFLFPPSGPLVPLSSLGPNQALLEIQCSLGKSLKITIWLFNIAIEKPPNKWRY
jgi:hypothetical protein